MKGGILFTVRVSKEMSTITSVSFLYEKISISIDLMYKYIRVSE